MYRFAFLAPLMVSAACFTALAAAPAAAASISSPPAPWRTLPPLPSLPSGTVGRHAEIGGARIWFAEWGPKSAGVPVLLLHGGFGNSNYFGRLIPALAAHGYRVIAMDSRGHGRSTRSDAPLTYDLMAQDVQGLLDQLGISKVYIVGWSDGGILGLDLALRHKDRVGKVFAFAANTVPSGVVAGVEKNPTFAAYIERAGHEYADHSATPKEYDAFVDQISKMWFGEPNWTDAELEAIDTPVLVVDGDHDEAIKRAHTEYIAATIPHASLLILPNVSHFAFLQDPDQFNFAILHFLGDE